MDTPAPTATMPSPAPVHAIAVIANVSVMEHLKSQPNEPGEEAAGAGWKMETEFSAAAATSALPLPHQATADTGAWRSMTWRKNGEQPSSPTPSLVSSREGEGRWDTTRKDPAA